MLDGSFMATRYLQPSGILKYFIDQRPLFVRGATKLPEMDEACEVFWTANNNISWMAWSFHKPRREPILHHIPLAAHGDSGKGKRLQLLNVNQFFGICLLQFVGWVIWSSLPSVLSVKTYLLGPLKFRRSIAELPSIVSARIILLRLILGA